MKISAIILAAGRSTRMGQPKVLMPVLDKPMFLHSVELALQSNLSPIYIVVGKYIEEINLVLEGMPVNTIFNRYYEDGMSTSLKKGIEAVSPLSDATIVFLADQPLTPKVVVEKMIKEYLKHRSNGVKIVRPKYNDKPGHPILIDSSLYKEFESIIGDVGGKSIIQRHKTEMKVIHFNEEDWGIDIDTMNEYQNLLEKLNS
jgi:molybdenum cofactor cytidylyltransferase